MWLGISSNNRHAWSSWFSGLHMPLCEGERMGSANILILSGSEEGNNSVRAFLQSALWRICVAYRFNYWSLSCCPVESSVSVVVP